MEPRVRREKQGDRLRSPKDSSVFSEPDVLSQLRKFPITDELRWATRSKKQKTFSGQVAIVINRLRVFSCDILFMALQGDAGTLSMIINVHRLLSSYRCSRPTAATTNGNASKHKLQYHNALEKNRNGACDKQKKVRQHVTVPHDK